MNWAGGMHWSQSARAWCGFFASLPRGPVLLRHELTWLGKPPELAAEEIKRALVTWGIVAPPDAKLATPWPHAFTFLAANPKLWPLDDTEPGETISETFLIAGLPMIRGNDDRINGWSRVRSWLAPRTWHFNGETFESPSLIVHPDCRYFLRAIPTLVMNPKEPDDVQESTEEFPVNGARYYAMARPMPTTIAAPELPAGAIGRDLAEIRAQLAADA